jgi:hypothetical protein
MKQAIELLKRKTLMAKVFQLRRSLNIIGKCWMKKTEIENVNVTFRCGNSFCIHRRACPVRLGVLFSSMHTISQRWHCMQLFYKKLIALKTYACAEH